MSILKVTNLTKRFYVGFWPFQKQIEQKTVQNVSFEVGKGEIIGLLGPNGAGKTTTIQMLLGTLTPTSGSIIYFDTDFAQNPLQCLQRIGYASAYDKLPAHLTIEQNLDIIGRIYGMPVRLRKEKIEQLLRFLKLWDYRDRLTGRLSAGQLTCVMLAKAFLNDPELVLLDEPTASLDPHIAQDIRTFILEQVQQRHCSVLITSHNMAEVAQLCHRVLVIKKGEIIANDTPASLAQSIAKVHLSLIFTSSIDQALTYISTLSVPYAVENNMISVQVDEHEIAQFLIKLAQQNIIYSDIAIKRPTLHDYFLSITKGVAL